MLIKKLHVLVFLGLLILGTAGHYYGPLRLNNQWKRHRWLTDKCIQSNLPKENCALRIPAPGSNELAYFDLCLEHGEWRRIK